MISNPNHIIIGIIGYSNQSSRMSPQFFPFDGFKLDIANQRRLTDNSSTPNRFNLNSTTTRVMRNNSFL